MPVVLVPAHRHVPARGDPARRRDRRDRGVRWYAIPLAGLGACVSLYHYLVEWHPQLEGDACDPANPCSLVWFREFGFVTLPLMALCGFVAIIALLLPCRRGELDDASDRLGT